MRSTILFMQNHSMEQPQFPGEPNSEDRAPKVQLFSAGSSNFGVFENEVATIAEWREPTPLPHAPESVLGVVSVQGRMLTVLDVAVLAGCESVPVYRYIIALRGDEQLALTASKLGQVMEYSTFKSENKTDTGERYVTEILTHTAMETKLLNVAELFPAALQGRERRRRRF